MKRTNTIIRKVSLLLTFIILLSACSSSRQLTFAEKEWHMSKSSGEIIDNDSVYRMTFDNRLIEEPLIILSSADSIKKYPGMDRFIAEILHTCHLDNAEILFYAPHMQTMFVRPTSALPAMRPSSISCQMEDENPYTMWVQEFDEESWIRKPSEMFTYTYFDKRRKQLLIVDHYDYADEPIAQITVFQSKNGRCAKMNIPEHLRSAYWHKDMKYFMRDIEFWSHQVDAHRKYAFENYKIGQKQKSVKK